MSEMVDRRAPKVYRPRIDIFVHPYKKLFRFEELHVEWIVAEVLGGETGEARGGALTTKQKLEAFLRYSADPGYQTGVGEDLGVNQSSVCRAVHDIIDRLYSVAGRWIHFPSTRAEKEAAHGEWTAMNAFPQGIGVIDCTHVEVLKPSARLHPDEYVNRKGFFSFNVQATCDVKERFTSVCAEWVGSVHDARILRNSPIPDVMRQTEQDFLLLGDSGYPISPWLMVPYRNPETPSQVYYNHTLAKERVVIERVFGQLKRRFPILGGCVRIKTERVPRLVIACAVLLNIAKHLRDGLLDDGEEGALQQENEYQQDEEGNGDAQMRRRGQVKRDALAHALFLRQQ